MRHIPGRDLRLGMIYPFIMDKFANWQAEIIGLYWPVDEPCTVLSYVEALELGKSIAMTFRNAELQGF